MADNDRDRMHRRAAGVDVMATQAQPMTTIGSLFSGAGGLDLAVEQVFSAQTIWHCETDPAASKVLAARWPGIDNLGDITAADWEWVPDVDILCGGFPCQDVSAAGRRAGVRDGTRSGLWAYFADAIAALHPSLVIIENVSGLLNARAHRVMERCDPIMGDNADGFVLRAAGAVLGDLADLGYDAQWTTVAASDIGVPHRRERVFIVATDAAGRRQHIDEIAGRTPRGQSLSATDECDSRPPTVARGDGWHEGRPESARLLPTPTSRDHKGANQRGDETCLTGALLPTPNAQDGDGGKQRSQAALDDAGAHQANLTDISRLIGDISWGKYEPAIRRWEALTRPAPSPTEPNTKGNPRLSAAFSEWMMGWPKGWVTHIPGISRNDALRIIGNGVVPQQATAALHYLLNVAAVAA